MVNLLPNSEHRVLEKDAFLPFFLAFSTRGQSFSLAIRSSGEIASVICSLLSCRNLQPLALFQTVSWIRCSAKRMIKDRWDPSFLFGSRRCAMSTPSCRYSWSPGATFPTNQSINQSILFVWCFSYRRVAQNNSRKEKQQTKSREEKLKESNPLIPTDMHRHIYKYIHTQTQTHRLTPTHTLAVTRETWLGSETWGVEEATFGGANPTESDPGPRQQRALPQRPTQADKRSHTMVWSP